MTLPSWRSLWQALPLGLEFWLPLPFVGLAFWLGGGVMSDRILSRPYLTTNQLPANTELAVNVAANDAVIQAQIHRQQQVTRVEVRSLNPKLPDLVFDLNTTELEQIEAQIAQKLGLTPAIVQKQIRYQLRP